MIRRTPLVAALLVTALGAASAAPSRFGVPSSGAALSLRAGLDGMGRPGRWLPVVVTITGGETAVDGTLAVTWGDAAVTQPVHVEGGASVDVRTTLRALDASPGVRATLTSGTGIVADIVQPLRLRGVDETVTLCIGPDAGGCTLSIDRAAAPRDWRPFDLADDVRWTGAGAPDDAQARALTLWRAMRWWNDNGSTDPILTPPDARPAGADSPVVPFGLMALTLVLGTLAARRSHPVIALAVPIILAGAATSVVARHRPPARLDTTGILRQFAGVEGGVMSLRGEVRHGDAAAIWARPALTGLDGVVIARRLESDVHQSALDVDGQAEFRAAAPRDARTAFSMDATLTPAWLDARVGGDGLSLGNRSAFTLAGCRWRADVTSELGDLAPGVTIALGRRSIPPGALVECRLPSTWLPWTGSTTIESSSHGWLVFHFWPGDGMTARGDDAAR